MSITRNYGCYNVEDVKKNLNERIEDKKAILEAWEKVSFPTKKDGSAFRQMSKNFSGATFCSVPYQMQAGETMLKVTTNNNGKYINDRIDCYGLVEYMKDEKKLAKKENYLEKEPFLMQVYRFDLDDIKDAISERIDCLKKDIEKLEEEKGKADQAFNDFQEAIKKAFEKLEDTTGSKRNDLYYLVEDTVLANKNY